MSITRSSPCAGVAFPGVAAVLVATLLLGGCSPPVAETAVEDPVTTPVAPEPRRDRLARIVEQYDAQGIHRTGTEVDRRSAAWLEELVREAGFEPALESFPFEITEVEAAFVELPGGERIDGIPIFDSPLTGPDGARGRLGATGSGARIELRRAPPASSYDPSFLEARRAGDQGALLAVTGGATWQMPEGWVLINADAYTDPYGAPGLQLPSQAWERLAAIEGQEVNVVTSGRRIPTEAFNVTVTVPGSDPELAPVVVMTPRSGWWNCASERGGGLAVWVELLHALATHPPARTVHFVASSGHELGHLGLHHYLEERAPLIAEAHLWLHLGANFATTAAPMTRLQASSQPLLDELVDALGSQGVEPDVITPVEQRPYGEAREIYDGGGRFVSVLGSNGLFHHPDDRWPDAVDLDRLERFAAAIVELVSGHTV